LPSEPHPFPVPPSVWPAGGSGISAQEHKRTAARLCLLREGNSEAQALRHHVHMMHAMRGNGSGFRAQGCGDSLKPLHGRDRGWCFIICTIQIHTYLLSADNIYNAVPVHESKRDSAAAGEQEGRLGRGGEGRWHLADEQQGRTPWRGRSASSLADSRTTYYYTYVRETGRIDRSAFGRSTTYVR
jgi:hypothetical protein